MLRVFLVVSWFCALGVPVATAQEQPSKVVSVAQPALHFERVVEGLPQTNVRAIAQDRRGFMWFGTQDGAARFDGVQFVTYRPQENDASSLSHKLVHAMTVDGKGDLWIGTENGLNRYDTETGRFKRYLIDAENPRSVTALHSDRQGRLWVATAQGGLDEYDPASDSFRHEKTPELETVINAIASDEQGLWLATAGDGVLRWTPGKSEVASFRHADDNPASLGSDKVHAIMVDQSGMVWAGTENGLCKIDPAGGKVTCFLPRENDPNSLSNEDVRILLQDRSGRLWVGTYRGFNLFDPKTGRFVQYHTEEGDPHSISYEEQTSIFQDRAGVIWVGTFGGGANKFDEMQLGLAYYRTGNTAATSFFQDEDRTLWVGTYQRGLFKFERENGRVTRYARLTDPNGAELDLESTWIGAIHRDKQGTLWLATQTLGLVGLDTKQETFVRLAPRAGGEDTETPALWGIVEDASGALWLAGWNEEGAGGLIRFDPKSREFSMSCCAEDDPELPSIALYTVRRDVTDANLLWLGGANSLARFDTTSDKTKNWFHDAKNPASIPGAVQSIHQEPSGILWLGTASGLARFDPNKGVAERMGAASGVPDNEIYGVLPDDAGRLWLSTNNRGLLVFDPKQKKVVLTYLPEDGLQDKEFAQGGYMRGRDGELFFGGPKGFNAFFPDRIGTDKYAPPVALTSFKLFNRELGLGRPVWTVDQISLDHDDSVFALEFAALSFAAPQRTRFAYRLGGVHDWIETTRPFVNYTNLGHGTYEFELKAMNRHGVWSEKPLKVDIVVARPPWLTWWAFALYGLAVVLAVLLVVRYFRRRVRLLRQESRLKSVERDLELISAVQTGFLPQNNHVVSPSFELFGFYRPADVCSGDWWWYEETAPGQHAFLVGDVTGHGAGPAMVTAAAATAFRVQAGVSLEQRLHSLNQEVLTVGGAKYFMTMSGLELDETTGEFTFYAAGGLPAIKLSDGQRTRVIPCRGTPLGQADLILGSVRDRMQPGERILLITDGMLEIKQRNGRQLGMRGFVRLAEESMRDAVPQGSQRVVSAIEQLQNETQQDDWTLLTIQWQGPGDVRIR